ncbi:CHAT domain-containing protein [Rubrivirga sp. IMCC43871]|uniref:CHAT domain-containing protein n=1 Tax=Rubrivirga sp. IMCC43871 TaxID=3391575 RepID=UPI00398FB74F
MTEYSDFLLRFENRADGLYVSSSSLAGGQVSAPLELPGRLDEYHLDALLEASSAATRGAAGGAHRAMIIEEGEPPTPVSAREVGSTLFHALLAGPVRDAFMRSQGSGTDNGVRIRLQIDPSDPALAELAGLPWELIYNDVTREALGRSKFTPVIRSFDVAQPYEMRPFAPPLRVLLVLANPSDTKPLDLDGEKRRVVATLEGLDNVEVTVIEHATEAKLYDALDTGHFHVLHYMGHGGFNDQRGGVLLLEDEHGRSVSLSASHLGDDLAERRAMRLVVLNACDTGRSSHQAGVDPFTGVASALVAAGIPAVVAMQVPVADRAALAFSDKFYSMIAQGEPVDAAVAVGRRAIWRSNEASLEWATPVLFMRASDGYLFGPPEAPEADAPALAADPAPAPDPAPTLRAPVVPEPTPSAGRKAKTWGLAALAIFGAVVGLQYLFTLSDDGEVGIGPDDVTEVDLGFADGTEVDAATALILAAGIADNVDDRAQQEVAADLMSKRPDGIPGEVETILYVSENEPESILLPVELGYEYVVVAVCDGDCSDVELELLQADGVTPLNQDGAVTWDDGTEPRLRITPSSADTYTLAVELIDCRTELCYVGVSVYAYGLE